MKLQGATSCSDMIEAMLARLSGRIFTTSGTLSIQLFNIFHINILHLANMEYDFPEPVLLVFLLEFRLSPSVSFQPQPSLP